MSKLVDLRQLCIFIQHEINSTPCPFLHKKIHIRTTELANISFLSPDSVQFASPVPLKCMADVTINRV